MQSSNITSRDNSLLKLARSVRDGKRMDLIFIEGLRLCEEALSSGLKITAVIFSEEIAHKERAAKFLDNVSRVCDRVGSVTEKLLTTISFTKTPQGVIALAEKPDSGPERLRTQDKNALLVVLNGINNPVNVGAILRSAEAAGATGVIATSQTSNPYSPKSLRGAMGSAFRLPIWFGASYEEALAWCSWHQIQTICAEVTAKTLYTDVDWRKPCALVMGPEATGLAQNEIELATEAIRIPMAGEVESLNVSVAAAILLYEAARQRQT